jgi:hypothetical protein
VLHTEGIAQTLHRHHLSVAELGPKASPLFQTPFYGLAVKPNSAQAMLRQLNSVPSILEGAKGYVEKKLPEAPAVAASYNQVRERMRTNLVDIQA